jgi:hypothetical protein
VATVNRSQIGDLNNARIREKAEVAVFVTLKPATYQWRKNRVPQVFMTTIF